MKAAQSEANEEDSVKKELEAKNKDIIDLKVRPHLPSPKSSSFVCRLLIAFTHRTNTFAV